MNTFLNYYKAIVRHIRNKLPINYFIKTAYRLKSCQNQFYQVFLTSTTIFAIFEI
jgi:hypothetical protein